MAKDTKLIPGTDSGHARNHVTEVREDLGQQKKWPLPIAVTIYELSYQTLWGDKSPLMTLSQVVKSSFLEIGYCGDMENLLVMTIVFEVLNTGISMN